MRSKVSAWYALVGTYAAFLCCQVQSHDLGVWGATYPIKEVDMATYMGSQVKKMPVKAIQKALRSSVKTGLQHLPTVSLPESHRIMYMVFDPSVRIGKEQKVLNPLRWVWPEKKWLIIQGGRVSHWALVRKLQARYPDQFWVLVVDMSMAIWEKSRNIGYMPPIYYAFPQLIQRFHVQSLPTLMGAGCDKKEKRVLMWALPAATPTSVIEKTVWPVFQNRDCR